MQNLRIPRLFHFIWLGDQPLPDSHKAYIETWQRHHPGWETKIWTDDNLPSLLNQREFDTASAYATKANVLRYEILHQFGGVYIDTDFECFRNIEALLQGIDAFAGEMKPGLVNNALIGASPNHPLMADVIRYLPGHALANFAMPSPFQSGPYLLNIVMRQVHPQLKIFPPPVFYPYSYEDRHVLHKEFNREEYPHAYAVHYWEISWRIKPLDVKIVVEPEQFEKDSSQYVGIPLN